MIRSASDIIFLMKAVKTGKYKLTLTPVKGKAFDGLLRPGQFHGHARADMVERYQMDVATKHRDATA